MDPRVQPLADTLRLNTRLFRNCLVDLTDEQARVQPSPATNSAAYVAAHVTESRYLLLKLMGAEQPSPLDRYLGGWKSIDQITEWPTLDQIREAWSEVAHALRDRLAGMTAADWDAPHGTRFPPEGGSRLDLLGFLVQHDSYHIGQLSWLRKYAGLPAMKYS